MSMKQYMVIEAFMPGCKAKVYERFHQKGRMMPEGLVYVNSWLEKDGDRCFQLVGTNNATLFQQWTNCWNDLMRFEIIEIDEKPKKKDDA